MCIYTERVRDLEKSVVCTRVYAFYVEVENWGLIGALPVGMMAMLCVCIYMCVCVCRLTTSIVEFRGLSQTPILSEVTASESISSVNPPARISRRSRCCANVCVSKCPPAREQQTEDTMTR